MTIRRTTHPACILGTLILSLVACSGSALDRPDLTVAAAASLRQVMPAVLESFKAIAGERAIEVTYGASGHLRRQVEGGAPIDLVVLASAEMVDSLVESGLAAPSTRRLVAENRLALVGRPEAAPLTFATLDRLPRNARLAVGDPRTVPAGHYARQTLESLGLWSELERRLVFGGHVASVLTYLRRGEVDAAIVYETDIRGLADISLWEIAAGNAAPRPQVVAAVINRNSQDARRLLDFLTSPKGREILVSFGFDTTDER